MNLMVNPVITDFRQDVNGDIKMLKLGANKEDAWANIAEQSASAKLDNNKTATINVSTYTEPVVINPTSGKDGMKKATITLSNIPSPSPATSVTFYAWKDPLQEENSLKGFTLSENPVVGENVFQVSSRDPVPITPSPSVVVSVGEDSIVIESGGVQTEVVRASAKDATYSMFSS